MKHWVATLATNHALHSFSKLICFEHIQHIIPIFTLVTKREWHAFLVCGGHLFVAHCLMYAYEEKFKVKPCVLFRGVKYVKNRGTGYNSQFVAFFPPPFSRDRVTLVTMLPALVKDQQILSQLYS